MTEGCTSCETRVIKLLQTLANSRNDHTSDATEEYIVHNAGVSPFTLSSMFERGILSLFYGKFNPNQKYYKLTEVVN